SARSRLLTYRPVHALRGRTRRRPLQESPRFAPRNRAAKPARRLPRRRRQLRIEESRIRRIWPRALGLPQARAPGQVHRLAIRSLPLRLSGAGPRHRGRARAPPRRKISRDASLQPLQRRRALRFALAAFERIRPYHRLLRHSRRQLEEPRCLHYYRADEFLAQLLTAR